MGWEGKDIKYRDCGKDNRDIMESYQKSNRKTQYTDLVLAEIKSLNESITLIADRRDRKIEWLKDKCSHPVSHQFVNKYSPEDTLGNFCDYSEYVYYCDICNTRLHKENR